MTDAMIFSSVIETVAVVGLGVGFIYEERVAAWERAQWRRFKVWLRRTLRRSARIREWAAKGTPREITVAVSDEHIVRLRPAGTATIYRGEI